MGENVLGLGEIALCSFKNIYITIVFKIKPYDQN
jgi:hypothetical protein